MFYQYDGRAVLDTQAYYNHGLPDPRMQPFSAEAIRRPLVGVVVDGIDGATHVGQKSGNPVPPPPPPMNSFHAVADARSSLQALPSSNSEGPWAAYDNIDPRHTKSLLIDTVTGEGSRHRYLLCPADIVGFILKPRRWGQCCH